MPKLLLRKNTIVTATSLWTDAQPITASVPLIPPETIDGRLFLGRQHFLQAVKAPSVIAVSACNTPWTATPPGPPCPGTWHPHMILPCANYHVNRPRPCRKRHLAHGSTPLALALL